MTTGTSPPVFPFLAGNGEMHTLTQQYNWAATPIGGPEGWPQSLRTMLSVILNARFPMFLWWGPELIQFYNDAYRPSLGINGKHPTALGQRAEICWPENWPMIKPLIDQVMAGGEATWNEDQLVPIYRNGRVENVYWTYSYSPVWSDTGEVVGVLVICQETTRQVLAAQQEKERFQLAIETAQLGLWELDPATNLLHWDSRCQELFGVDSNPTPYEQAIAAIHPDDRDQVRESVAWSMNPKSGGHYDLTYRVSRPHQNQPRWVRFTGQSYFNEADEVLRFAGLGQDVTADRQAQQQVEASEAYLQRIFRSAAVGIAIFRGPAFVIDVANPGVCVIWGRTEADILGKPLFEALPEAAGQGFEEILATVMRTNQPFTGRELPAIINRNGQFTTVYFDFVYEPLPDADGTVNQILVTASDATERRKARQQIEANEAHLRLLFEQAPIAIAILRGPDMVYELTNKKYLQLVNRLPPGDLIGKPLLVGLPELRGQGIAELLQEVLQTGKSFTATERSVTILKSEQLETNYFNFVYEPLRDTTQEAAANGTATGVFMTGTDVTEQVLARQQIEANEAHLQRIFRHAAVTLAILRGPEFIIERANPVAYALWDRTEAQALGKPFFDVLPESTGQGFEAILANVLQTSQPFVGTELPVQLFRHGKLETAYFDLVYEPLADDGEQPNRILVTGTEVTERILTRQKVDQLLVRERELNELKSNFVTLASHEFRTPMGTILSSAALIGRYNGPQDGEKRDRHVQRIKSAVHSLTGLLNDFLSLSQMEQATMYGRPHQFDLVLFCTEVIEDMQGVIKPGQRVVYQHLSGLPVIVLDGQMLKNILINLLVNASKYSADKKEIDLTTTIQDDQLVITVKDQGIGIPDADKDRLFISFFRARNAVHVEGTGLGLYVVKRYVDLLGGLITFTSEVDSGTIFTIQLPLSPAPL